MCAELLFTWMTPLMKQGFKKPITDRDVWQLDDWDQTEHLYGEYVINLELDVFYVFGVVSHSSLSPL